MTQNARLALWVPTATPPDVKDIIATQGPPVGSVIPTAFEQPGSGGGGVPSDAPPLMDGAVAPGTATAYSRGDHRHPTDTSKANASHTHPESDVTNLITDLAAKAPLVSPSFTGTPLTPTAATATNTTQIASTAFVKAAIAAGGSGGGIPEAPTDGQLYSRKGSTAQWLPSPTGSGGGGLDQATADALYVNVAGDTMTGDLTLTTGSVYATSGTVDAMFVNGVVGQFENAFVTADPTDPLGLATKQYVDAHAGGGGGGAASGITFTPAGGVAATNVQAAIAEVDAEKVAKTGDTMTGALQLPDGVLATPGLRFTSASSGLYYSAFTINFSIQGVQRAKIASGGIATVDGLVSAPSYSFIADPGMGLYRKSAGVIAVTASSNNEIMSWSATAVTSLKPVVLPLDPVNPLEAATKQYVDNKPATDNTKVLKAGDTMTGNLAIVTASGNAVVQVDATSAGQSLLNFREAGVVKWQFGRQAGSSGFFINDIVSGGPLLNAPSGGTTVTFSKTVILPADPTNPLEAATKQYVDNKPGAPDATKVAKAGDTMTGALVMMLGSAAAPGIALTGFPTSGIYGTPGVGYLNTTVNGVNTVTFTSSAVQINGGVAIRNQSGSVGSPTYTFGADTNSGIYRESLQNIGFAINGAKVWSWEAAALTAFQPLMLAADPTVSLQAATKQYVDSKSAPAAATAAEYVSNSAPTKMLTSGATWAATVPLTQSEVGTTITPDMSLGLDFEINLNGTGRTFANPLNPKRGQKGMFVFINVGMPTGAVSVTWGSAYKFPGGIKPAFTQTVAAVDVVNYYVHTSGMIICSYGADFK